jgi:hypothetical protein
VTLVCKDIIHQQAVYHLLIGLALKLDVDQQGLISQEATAQNISIEST